MDKQVQDFYNMLKKLGFQTEFKLNENIQDSLNKKDILKLLHRRSHLAAPLVENLKELVETISVPLNIPTKNDVANVAKLTQQNEEKLDSVEEQLKILNKYLKQLISDDVPTYTPSSPSKDDNKLKKLKKLLVLQTLLQNFNNLGARKE